MKRAMSKKKPPENDWLLIGQLSLPVASVSGESLDGWITRTLGPLVLPPELYSKLMASVEEALSRLNTSSSSACVSSIKFYVSLELNSEQTSNASWGFFKLERLENTFGEPAPVGYVLEYYLYLER